MRMSFRLDGHEFELTQELVRSRLKTVEPEPVREYWVEIDGTKWPVKQVMAVATGLDRRRFQSQNSRRLLAKLGFVVGVGASPGGADSAPRRRVAASAGDPAAMPELESLSATVALTWRRAGAVTLDDVSFPSFPRLPHVPGLYRFDFGFDETGLRTLYIGESVDIARRASNYRNAKTDRSRQRTSRRIHKAVLARLMAGGAIEYAIATKVLVGDKPIDLRFRSARRLAANAAVFLAQATPSTRVLNIDAELDLDPGDDDS